MTLSSIVPNVGEPSLDDHGGGDLRTLCHSFPHLFLFLHIVYICSGYLGASGCMVLASWGSAWGTWRAGMGVCQMGIDHPKGVIKNIVPIVMAGVLGIYGLIVSVIITQSISSPGGDGSNTYSVYNGYTHVSCNLLHSSSQCPYVVPFLCLTSFHSFPLVCCRYVLWSFLFGCRRYHRCNWRCWSSRIWIEGRTRTKMVLGR